MKFSKAIRKQARTAERAATGAADSFAADQIRLLALAIRAQADVPKRNKKNK
jgi:hypothetical protein